MYFLGFYMQDGQIGSPTVQALEFDPATGLYHPTDPQYSRTGVEGEGIFLYNLEGKLERTLTKEDVTPFLFLDDQHYLCFASKDEGSLVMLRQSIRDGIKLGRRMAFHQHSKVNCN